MVFWKTWKYSCHFWSCIDSLMITNYTLLNCMWETFGLNWITCFFQLKYHLQIHIIISTQTYIHTSQFTHKYINDQVNSDHNDQWEGSRVSLAWTLRHPWICAAWIPCFRLFYNFSHSLELSIAFFLLINTWSREIINAKLGSKSLSICMWWNELFVLLR